MSKPQERRQPAQARSVSRAPATREGVVVQAVSAPTREGVLERYRSYLEYGGTPIPQLDEELAAQS